MQVITGTITYFIDFTDLLKKISLYHNIGSDFIHIVYVNEVRENHYCMYVNCFRLKII